jgi:hypothetical protein
VASWFETRGVAAHLTKRVENALEEVKAKNILGRPACNARSR